MILTNWGYTLTEVDKLPDMLEEWEFDEFTAGKYNRDARIGAEIKAAQSAIRNYVGWHLAGPLKCEVSIAALQNNVSVIGGRDTMVQLPARYVSEVESVEIGGNACENFDIQTNGLLTVFDTVPANRYDRVKVVYTAGLCGGASDSVKEIIAHRVTHALANSYGIQSESSGGVSVAYSANWVNSARASALPDDNKEVLAPYRLQGVF